MENKILQSLKTELSSSNLEELLTNLLKETDIEKQYNRNDSQKLIEVYQKLLEHHEFKVGDLVKWKQGLTNKILPEINQPAIVIKLLKEPLIDRLDEEAGSRYYREPLDIILGLFDDKDEFLMFYYDKRRFEPYYNI
ncbi:hypothetical protein [Candidatus Marithrix sp. Canyon 246]|uniref:hypothetical protein n=1 Tax=Candidatus Marithrix sp. Canyon 246 TaxID=1827136 RepID=UPI00084A0561|nr:hypothetical protein [Candidatus Marithrix sp. Canyon 246]